MTKKTKKEVVEKKYKEFNVNQYVKVKLNNLGGQMFIDHWTQFISQEQAYDRLKRYTDENGYTEFQMYELANIFGSQLVAGKEPPFDTVILIAENDLTDHIVENKNVGL